MASNSGKQRWEEEECGQWYLKKIEDDEVFLKIDNARAKNRKGLVQRTTS
jgi:hypothetical protein